MLRFLSLILFALLAVPLCGGTVRVPLPSAMDLDETGKRLRAAVTAWEAVLNDPRPTAWTRVMLAPGETAPLGGENFLLMLPQTEGRTRVVVIGAGGTKEATLEQGREVAAGDYQIILLSTGGTAGRIEVMLRTTAATPAPVSTLPSAVKISGNEKPRELIITSDVPNATEFAAKFLQEIAIGQPPEAAAATARTLFPPVRSGPARTAPTPTRSPYVDPANMFDEVDDGPFGVLVTLHLVRADRETLNTLSNDIKFDSSGTFNRSPRVGAETGGQGADVRVGSPGDMFRIHLKTLESSGKADTESSTVVNVAFGDSADFSLSSGGRNLNAELYAVRRGNRAELQIRNRTGDWDLVGAVSTRIRLADGGTIMVARNNYTRSSSQQSGVPILGQVPYIGPAFGSSSKATESLDYALFATAEFQE